MPANLIWQSQAREDLLLIYKFVGLDLVRSRRPSTTGTISTSAIGPSPRACENAP
jgi:hypothetical protein